MSPYLWSGSPQRYRPFNLLKNTLPGPDPVSYTHLDVYKRQADRSVQANAEWNEKIEPLKLICDEEKYWENPFQQPTFGPISTQFGSIRYTNDDPTPTRHNGTDIAAARGTVVSAANNGRVLLDRKSTRLNSSH